MERSNIALRGKSTSTVPSPFAFALGLALFIACPPTAFADTSASDMAAARALALEGMTLADRGQCGEAIEKLQKAEQLHHAPTILGRLGECQVNMGKLVIGTENLRAVLREHLPAGSSAAYAAAQERAAKVLETALPKLGSLKISVKRPPGVEPTVMMDGTRLSNVVLDAATPADPGKHRVEVSAPGYKTASATVTLNEAGKEAVVLTLEVDPAAIAPPPPQPSSTDSAKSSPPPAPAETASQPPVPPPATEGKNTPVAAYVLGGIGIVGLGTGAVLGIMANGKKSDLLDTCPNKECPETAQSDIDSMKRLGNTSTIFVGAGAGFLALGTIVYFVSGTSSSQTGKAQPQRLVARPWLSPSSVGLSGSF